MKLKEGMRVLLKSKDKIEADLITAEPLPGGYYHGLLYVPTMLKRLGKVVTIEHVFEPGDKEFCFNKNYGGALFMVDGYVYNEQIIECIIEDEKEYDFSTPLGIIHCTLQLAKTIACGYMTMSMLGAEHYSYLVDPLLDKIESIETKEE